MKVLVIDDHPLIREAMTLVLTPLAPAVQVLQAADCEAGLSVAASLGEAGPDLVLLDLQLAGLSGLAAIEAWRQRFPLTPLVVVSASTDPNLLRAALAAGAAGFVPKATTKEVLLAALRLVLDGGRYLPPQLLETGVPQANAPHEVSGRLPVTLLALGLTVRQRDVLRLLADGASNKVIARELGLAERTVKAHVTAVLRVLGVGSRTQVAIAVTRLRAAENP